MKKLLNFNGRPCEIERNERVKARNPRWGFNDYSIVRYLDGLDPKTEKVAAGKIRKAKPIRETESIFWRRADELITGGMEVQRAKDQARAELTKGLLTQPAF